jgi:hypothetical protein
MIEAQQNNQFDQEVQRLDQEDLSRAYMAICQEN